MKPPLASHQLTATGRHPAQPFAPPSLPLRSHPTIRSPVSLSVSLSRSASPPPSHPWLSSPALYVSITAPSRPNITRYPPAHGSSTARPPGRRRPCSAAATIPIIPASIQPCLSRFLG
ncbi:hypothetical protein NL676_014369 [Syzygium grande]|nr:hypothetical protein NL676_014369 [Syzygium grande]